jgi:hypothetical protein
MYTAHYGFSLTSCGSSEKLAPAILRGRIGKPCQESAPHKVRENHIMMRQSLSHSRQSSESRQYRNAAFLDQKQTRNISIINLKIGVAAFLDTCPRGGIM